MLSKPVRDAAHEIGQFYLQKHTGDYAAAEREITSLRITKLTINENALHITAARVGVLIGRRGTNIDALGKFINDRMQMKVKIFEDEDCLVDCLIPRKEEEY